MGIKRKSVLLLVVVLVSRLSEGSCLSGANPVAPKYLLAVV